MIIREAGSIPVAKDIFMKGLKMKRLKRKIFLFFRKHYKIYTLLILLLGIALGCAYDGRDEIGSFYFKIGSQVYYVGALQ